MLSYPVVEGAIVGALLGWLIGLVSTYFLIKQVNKETGCGR